MKKINIIYWIATGLLLALMLWSAIGSFIDNPQAAAMMVAMGYKAYIFHFLAVAKILGIIAILTPGFPRLKEWAYAGFTFDLLGATYSLFVTYNNEPAKWAPMFVFLALLACSYIYYHKKLKLKAGGRGAVV